MRKEVETLIRQVQGYFPEENITLENVNDFFMILMDKRNCDACKGLENCPNSNQGYYLSKSGKEFVQTRCALLKEKQSSTHTSLLKSEYSEAKSDASLENFDLNSESRKKVLEFIKKFINGKNNKKGLYLYGTYAIGKTYSLMVTAKEMSKAGIDHIFVYFPDLVNELKGGLENAKFDKIIDLLKETDVLLLDDFGAEAMTPWLRDNVIGPIVNYRMNYQKPVFIASNVSPDKLSKHFMMNQTDDEKTKAGRIVSRLTSLVDCISMDDTNKYTR